jgi:hypothetical protein
MKRSLSDQLHEWFADGSTRSQYPNPAWQRQTREPIRLRWTHSMPLWKRAFFFTLGLFALLLALPLLAASLLFAWSLLRQL